VAIRTKINRGRGEDLAQYEQFLAVTGWA